MIDGAVVFMHNEPVMYDCYPVGGPYQFMTNDIMKTIKTAADIASLSEQDKDIVFAFDTARERLKGGLIRSLLIPSTVIAGSLLSLFSMQSIEGMDWVRPASEWAAYIGIAVGLLGVPLFSRRLKGDYQAMQATKQLLAERGIDASKMRSDEVWAGLFTQPKAG